MTPQVRDWVWNLQGVEGPVLEVGSYDANGSLRDLFNGMEYVGLDMREGPNVDIVRDIMDPWEGAYGTVVCVETLEHIAEPWRAIDTMHSILKPGGLFAGAWVFNWEIHGHPNDYWRVTPEGFKYLLNRSGFVEIEATLAEDHHVYATARRAA